MRMNPPTIAAKDVIAILIAREEELEAELAAVQEKLVKFSESHPDAWMQAMDEGFQRVHSRLTAKLASRPLGG